MKKIKYKTESDGPSLDANSYYRKDPNTTGSKTGMQFYSRCTFLVLKNLLKLPLN